jgi:hypothetical protein
MSPPSTTESLAELERRHGGRVLALGAAALEMHQRGELDESDPYRLRRSAARLMQLAAEAAETERELELRRPGAS